MKQPTEKNYTAALYLRLSKDDGVMDKDSASIDTQRDMLTRYCNENGIIIHDLYIDDGFTGLNTDRPGFKKMIEDVEAKKVNCVITKDQSRLGRNHLESDFYMEVYFPEHGIRYIALNDNVDTLNASSLDIAPFRNLLNDMYAQDISKKVKSALYSRQKQGKFIGNKAPYGYAKDPADKNHLIVDERYAPIVRRIYSLYLEGNGVHKIANILRSEKIPKPAAAAMEFIDAYSAHVNTDEDVYGWREGAVDRILTNPVYAGHVQGQYRPKISAKSKKRHSINSKSFIVENMHEPIIEPEKWELVQTIIKSHHHESGKDGYDNIFAGLLRCADCGKTLTKTTAHRRKPRADVIDMIGYQCNYYRLNGKSACTQHWLEARDLYNAVLADIQHRAKCAIEDDDKMISEIISKIDSNTFDDAKKAEKELRRAKSRIAELDKLFSSLYEDKVSGNISERNFKQLSAKYDTEQITLESRIAELENTVSNSKATAENVDTFVNLIKDFSLITELNSTILNTLIEKIVVHEAEVVDGEKVQKIEIYYKFVGRI